MKHDFYRAFEERHRGSRESVKARLTVYLPFIVPLLRVYPAAAVVDLGCGRGEWLETLAEAGFHPLGVDLDEGMLEACRQQNLDVRHADIATVLAGLPDESQAVVSAFHVVEHLEFAALRALVDEALRVLKPGGVLLMETPNPENLYVATSYFYLDHTHRRPLPPMLLEFVAEHAGFQRRKLLRLQEDKGFADEQRVRMRDFFYGVSPDYAIVAQKDAPPEILALLDPPFANAYGLSMDALLARIDHRFDKLEDETVNCLQTQLQKTQRQIQEAQARFLETQARLQEAQESAQAQLQALHASTSWRLTRPLRALKRLVRGDFPIRARIRQRTRDGIVALSRHILRHSALRRVLVRTIKASPKLHRLLLRLIGIFGAPPAGPDLSPWAARIHKALTTAAAATDPADAPAARPRLAYVSPLPPEPSGISTYSAELLPALHQWYDIEVIVTQATVNDEWIHDHCPIRSVEWFRAHAARFDRVLYHFGNSFFHQHMFALLDEIPGLIVLHDFFLSSVQARRALFGEAHVWERTLCASHGYRALAAKLSVTDAGWRYPVNLPVLQAAQGVIVHSEHARRLAAHWYGGDAGRNWTVLPLLRAPATRQSGTREAARKTLGVAADSFLVCAFGVMGQTKLNDRLIDAWLASPLADDPRAQLVFVGEHEHGDYGRKIAQMILRGKGRIRITGWTDADIFKHYLWAADIGVQLRTMTRGETSATVLDCMNHGLATIINAHGSMADLDAEGLWKLPDDFSDQELIDALLALSRDPARRKALGAAAQAIVTTRHAPEACARQYAETIERASQAAGWTAALPKARESANLETLAATLAREFPPVPRRRQLLVDVSAIAQVDLRTGIQRVVRAVLGEWLAYDEDWQVEPVRAVPEGYRYARRFTCRLLGIDEDWAEDALVDAWAGDVFFGLDFHHSAVPEHRALLEDWRNAGVRVGFLVYDLLPVTHPGFFPEEMAQHHARWLETISTFDMDICISRATADALESWQAAFRQTGPSGSKMSSARIVPFAKIAYFHIGADLAGSVPTSGLPPDAEAQLCRIKSSPAFLMVGTVEPRKGHADVLDAFDILWKRGLDINLVIVGKEGWMVDTLAKRLRADETHEPRLIWLENVSDEYLEQLYGAAVALIAASHAEGFGLPLIEAARHGLPVIARDIPVFREVAGEHAYYFNDLASALETWLEHYQQGRHPTSDGMPWLSWKESARQLWRLVIQEEIDD